MQPSSTALATRELLGELPDDPLVAMGMGIAFGADADFSGLSPRGKGLYISEVKQKTYVDVNEDGIEFWGQSFVCQPNGQVVERTDPEQARTSELIGGIAAVLVQIAEVEQRGNIVRFQR